METDVEAMLRLAWLADREGRAGTRDALLTLAMSRSTIAPPPSLPADLPARCQNVLKSRLPSYWFDNEEASRLCLKNDKVAHALAKLQMMFPAIRIRRLLMRADTLQGPYLGRVPRLGQLLEDLNLESTRTANSRRDVPRSFPLFLGSHSNTNSNDELIALYWSVLVAMAVLLNLVIQSPKNESDQRAA